MRVGKIKKIILSMNTKKNKKMDKKLLSLSDEKFDVELKKVDKIINELKEHVFGLTNEEISVIYHRIEPRTYLHDCMNMYLDELLYNRIIYY